MKVAKWGNSLAVRLPADVVEKLGLQAGDDLEGRFTANGRLEIGRKLTREEAVAALMALPKFIPAEDRFSRDDAYGD